jgi:hypothetical protein
MCVFAFMDFCQCLFVCPLHTIWFMDFHTIWLKISVLPQLPNADDTKAFERYSEVSVNTKVYYVGNRIFTYPRKLRKNTAYLKIFGYTAVKYGY